MLNQSGGSILDGDNSATWIFDTTWHDFPSTEMVAFPLFYGWQWTFPSYYNISVDAFASSLITFNVSVVVGSGSLLSMVCVSVWFVDRKGMSDKGYQWQWLPLVGYGVDGSTGTTQSVSKLGGSVVWWGLVGFEGYGDGSGLYWFGGVVGEGGAVGVRAAPPLSMQMQTILI